MHGVLPVCLSVCLHAWLPAFPFVPVQAYRRNYFSTHTHTHNGFAQHSRRLLTDERSLAKLNLVQDILWLIYCPLATYIREDRIPLGLYVKALIHCVYDVRWMLWCVREGEWICILMSDVNLCKSHPKTGKRITKFVTRQRMKFINDSSTSCKRWTIWQTVENDAQQHDRAQNAFKGTQ